MGKQTKEIEGALQSSKRLNSPKSLLDAGMQPTYTCCRLSHPNPDSGDDLMVVVTL